MSAIPNPKTTAVPEPTLVAIPAGWFLMGSEAGQDNERPVHRVWIDAFQLAACQVTNAEYGNFLCATGSLPPPFWQDPNFSQRQQPVVGVSWFEAAKYCEWLVAATGSARQAPRFRPSRR